jgi:ACS family D-galactonate transporter-like MFS transporter
MIVQATGSYYMALMLFAGAGVGLFISSTLLISYKKIPV